MFTLTFDLLVSSSLSGGGKELLLLLLLDAMFYVVILFVKRTVYIFEMFSEEELKLVVLGWLLVASKHE